MKSFFTFIILLTYTYSNAQTFTPYNWVSPLYGSHVIKRVASITGSKFIAIGDEGMLLLSNDDGLTWNMNQQATTINFKAIHIFDSLHFIIGGSHQYYNSFIYKTNDGGLTWSEVANFPNMALNDIHFPNDSIGYGVGAVNKLIKTTDGGNTWTDASTASLTGDLQSVQFLNSDTGFVGKTTTNAAMFWTTNGGLTWSQVFGYSGSACYTIKFVNDTMGYAGAYNSRIYKTVNGGLTWGMQTSFTTSEAVRNISFKDAENGIAVTNSYVYRTSNGSTWTGPFQSGGNNFYSCALSANGVAVLGDSYGGLHYNTNQSTTFANVNTNKGFHTYGKVKFVNPMDGWIGGDGYNVLKTNDGGLTWTNTNANTYIDNMNDMEAISSAKLIMVTGGSEGKVVSTVNGGTSFVEQTLSTSSKLNAVSFPSATVGYVVGNNGVAFKTINGGTSYSAMTVPFTNNILDVFFATPQFGYILNEYGDIRKTTNGGTSWTNLSISGMNTPQKLFFLSTDVGYVVNDFGLVFKTTDAGVSFTAAGQTCINTPFDMQFINDSTGFVVGSFTNASCDISYTTNSGATWQSMLFPYEFAGWGVYAFDTAHVFLTGQNQTIIRVGEGGLITSNKQDNTQLQSLNEVALFPNPANTAISFYANQSPSSIKILTIDGRLMKVISGYFNQMVVIDISDFSNGLYFLESNTNGKLQTAKFIKQ